MLEGAHIVLENQIGIKVITTAESNRTKTRVFHLGQNLNTIKSNLKISTKHIDSYYSQPFILFTSICTYPLNSFLVSIVIISQKCCMCLQKRLAMHSDPTLSYGKSLYFYNNVLLEFIYEYRLNLNNFAFVYWQRYNNLSFISNDQISIYIDW
jgi:hypothetical protein